VNITTAQWRHSNTRSSAAALGVTTRSSVIGAKQVGHAGARRPSDVVVAGANMRLSIVVADRSQAAQRLGRSALLVLLLELFT